MSSPQPMRGDLGRGTGRSCVVTAALPCATSHAGVSLVMMCVGMGVGTSRSSGVGAGVRVDLFAFACHSALTIAIPTKAARGDG